MDVVSGVGLVIGTRGGPDSSRFPRVLKRGGTMLPVFFAQYDRKRRHVWHHRLRVCPRVKRPGGADYDDAPHLASAVRANSRSQAWAWSVS